jgi:hypothetical protein
MDDVFLPATVLLRGELIDDPEVALAALFRRSIELAIGRVVREPSCDMVAITVKGWEAVQDALLPAIGRILQLESSPPQQSRAEIVMP